jgi:predicted unusual protein kinase regulating ubiquinone biosynthesis (AarF/ABC1/UbiB family)
MGTLFLKLGQLLSTRRDLMPPEIIEQLVQLQDKVKPFDSNVAIAQIQDPKHGLGQSIGTLFARFDVKPLAAASIAQVHTAALHDGREVVIKVVRPDIRTTIVADFELLRELANWASARIGHEPRYIGLDCAIMGTLSKDDQLIVARMLLAVMNNNFTAMVDIVSRAGWIPPNTDKHALMRDMKRTVGPMLQKSINDIDFAGVLMQILDIARRHHMSIPPQLMLLLKTLVHVEGLGRDLYPDLDIWSLAKPILSSWIKEQLDPMRNLQQLRAQLPEILLSTTDIPKLLDQGLQSLASQGSRQDSQLREIQQIRADMLNDRRRDWLALAGFVVSIAIAIQVGWFAPIFYLLAILVVVWRILA